jgi:hypothetical protein
MSEAVSIKGLNELFRKIDKIAKWTDKDSKKLQNIGHKVGDVYASNLKTNIKDYHKPIIFRGKKITPGQLKRSAGTWMPDKSRNNVIAGPRTNSIGRRKTKRSADGFYAHIVEKGDFGPRFGGKHRTQNTGVFSRGLKATNSRMRKLQLILYRKEFARYIKAA